LGRERGAAEAGAERELEKQLGARAAGAASAGEGGAASGTPGDDASPAAGPEEPEKKG
jgi:hypothetical protein